MESEQIIPGSRSKMFDQFLIDVG